MDRDQADLAFADVVDAWLREALSGDVDGLLAEMVLREPTQTVDLVNTILRHLRSGRTLIVEAPPALAPIVSGLQKAAGECVEFLRNTGVDEPATVKIAE